MKALLFIAFSFVLCKFSFAQLACNAGPDKYVCPKASTTIGGSPAVSGGFPPYIISWLPTTGLSSSTAQNPSVSINSTTTYTLTVKDVRDSIRTDSVTVIVYSLEMSAGNDTTIYEGESITLFASPNDSTLSYTWWSLTSSINYNTTYNPDVNPNDTSTYILTIKDVHGCSYIDSVTVNVIPRSDLVFYTSITPNADGDNDLWIISNLEKYPKNRLQIFNRYGQEIYAVNDYKNDWNGKYLGKELPAGTYFFTLDTKSDQGIKKGSITIYR